MTPFMGMYTENLSAILTTLCILIGYINFYNFEQKMIHATGYMGFSTQCVS